uniref:DDE Tnp4 domain-containing protein n=1 Tax=Phytophthora ramorum TaxID=164328 RepID=H3GYU3_PHYRM
METVTKLIQLIAPKLYVDQVESRCDDTKMRAVATSGNAFSYFPCALYAVDVTFQQSWRPGGFIQENDKYYSGKHHLYGLKVEVSVDTRGFAINCSEHAKGATHDITMFKDNKSFHQAKMAKLPGEEVLHDDGPLKEKFPNEWAILADKGYQGLANYLRCIHPKKGRSLSRAEETSNDQISSDRVIVENYFGRLNVLWRITTDKYRWNESLYDDVFRLSVALTNFHVSISPLREQNGEWYRQSQHKLIQLGLKIKGKRRLAQEKYRAKKRQTSLD